MKILLIGFGNAGARYFRILRSLGHQVHVVDPKRYQDRENVRQFTRLPKDVSGYECFFVCTAPQDRDFLPLLAEQEKVTMIEKPLTYPGTWTMDELTALPMAWLTRVVVGLQMPFMPSYEVFTWSLRYREIAGVHVVAKSDARQWRGARGPHRQVLAPEYEFAHDLNLGFRLLQDRPRTRFTWELDLFYAKPEERRLEVTLADGEVMTFVMERASNVVAYGAFARAVVQFAAEDCWHECLTSYSHWGGFEAFLNLKGGADENHRVSDRQSDVGQRAVGR